MYHLYLRIKIIIRISILNSLNKPFWQIPVEHIFNLGTVAKVVVVKVDVWHKGPIN